MRRLSITTLVLAGVLLAVGVFAAVPPMINYQGKLMQPSGVPVNDGTYGMTFAIYPTDTGGTALWSEPNPGVQVKGGLFSALLGSIVNLPANIFDSPDRWFGVTVGTDPEMTPRQRVASSPYAFTAGNGVPVGGVIMWSGSVASIPQGWALCDGMSGTPDLRDRFIVGAGSGYVVGTTGGIASNNLSHSHIVNAHSHGGSTSCRDLSGPGGICEGQDSPIVDSGGSNIGHAHAIGLQSPGTSSVLGTVDNRPPYYALCFIMKLP